MGKDEALGKAFSEFKKQPAQIFPAEVVAVDRDSKTIVVKDADDFEFDEVRLTAAIDSKKKVVLYPKEKSEVLVSKLGDGDHVYFVVAVSEVAAIEAEIETTKFIIDAEGYEINKGDENLKTVFNDLTDQVGKICDEVSAITVEHGTSPNVGALAVIKTAVTETIKERLNNILK